MELVKKQSIVKVGKFGTVQKREKPTDSKNMCSKLPIVRIRTNKMLTLSIKVL